MGGTETADESLWRIESRAVGAGAASGAVAGVAMGIVLQFGTELLPEFGAFVGEVSVLRGWLVHLIVSVLYGVAFAVVVAYPPVRSFMTSFTVSEYTLAGLTYATMIAAVTITLLPFVFELPWATASTQQPASATPAGLDDLVPAVVFGVAHLVYGTILGFVYALVGRRDRA